jgi:hypothetical protein
MQAADILNYIKNPQLLNKQSIKPLQKLVKDFPYFQSAHVLLSLAAKTWDASVYQQSLKKTAIVVTNRSHLFQLIHQLENDTSEHLAKENIAKEITIETANENNSKEATKHELDILKATEVSAEGFAANETLSAKKEPLNAEDILEKEIQHQVVNAFVEKEILKTPELHHLKQKQEPESFVEWLYLLKKNNGQTHEQISEQVQKKQQGLKNKYQKKKNIKPLLIK